MYYLPENLHNFESIINETETQHNQFKEHTLELQKIKKDLFLLNLSSTLKNESPEISLVEVIVCTSLLDLEELTSEYTLPKRPEECQFIVVQLFIPNCLQKIFKENEFNINISVSCDKTSVCKMAAFEESSEIKEVIPVSESWLDCTVDILIYGKISGKNIVFKIPSVNVNISYFFLPSINVKKNRVSSREDKISKLCCLHNTNSDENIMKDFHLKYQLFNSLSQPCLMERILKNCYTYLNLASLSFDDKSVLRIQNKKLNIFITYKKEKNILQLESNIIDLCGIKKYLINELDTDELREKDRIQKLSTFNIDDCADYMEIYRALRSFSYMNKTK